MTAALLQFPRLLLSGRSLRLRRSPREVSHLVEGLEQRVYMRRVTSDLIAAHQVFGKHQYRLPRDYSPRVIYDCGAHLGLATLFFATRYPDATVVAIEPHPANFDLLRRNTEHLPNVHAIEGAIWPDDTDLAIANPWAQPWGFRVRPSSSGRVSAITLERLAETYGHGEGTVLKLDIEGAECALVSQMGSSILDFADVTFIEFHGLEGRSAAKLLETRNYHVGGVGDTRYYLKRGGGDGGEWGP